MLRRRADAGRPRAALRGRRGLRSVSSLLSTSSPPTSSNSGRVHRSRTTGRSPIAWTNSRPGQGVQQCAPARKSGARAASSIAVDALLKLGSAPPRAVPRFSTASSSPGETVVPFTAWTNDTAARREFGVGIGSPLLTGPPGADYTLNDNTALYGTVPAGQTVSCSFPADCYSVTVSDPRGPAGASLGRPVAGDLEPEPAAHMGPAHRRELRRRLRPITSFTPLHRESLSQRRHGWLRRGVIARTTP